MAVWDDEDSETLQGINQRSYSVNPAKMRHYVEFDDKTSKVGIPGVDGVDETVEN